MRPKDLGWGCCEYKWLLGVHHILKQEISPKRKILETFSPDFFVLYSIEHEC